MLKRGSVEKNGELRTSSRSQSCHTVSHERHAKYTRRLEYARCKYASIEEYARSKCGREMHNPTRLASSDASRPGPGPYLARLIV